MIHDQSSGLYSILTPCATFFSVRVRARDRARARTETPSFGKKSVQDFDGSSK